MNDILIKYDTIEKVLNGSLIQHGKHNDRIYLLKTTEKDIPELFSIIEDLVYSQKYSKVVCKVPKSIAPAFFANGFIMEAYIPGFYNHKEDMFFVSKFLNSDRLLHIENKNLETFSEILKKEQQQNVKTNANFSFRELTTKDVKEITQLFSIVFKTYPFPVHEEDYILQNLKDNVRYFGAFYKDKLVAIASSEMDKKAGNAEMTDFATHPEFSGNNLAIHLLNKMEEAMKEAKINTLYTIARLKSVPMNLTFIRNKYKYSGTLIKNTNISGDIESMNIYYKHL